MSIKSIPHLGWISTKPFRTPVVNLRLSSPLTTLARVFRSIIGRSGYTDEETRMSEITFAILNSDGVPEVCDFEQWERWFFECGGRDQMRIKRDLVNNWEIETFFRGNSVEMEGPLPFWEVTANHPSRTAFLERFGTKEAALKIHETLKARALADEPFRVSVANAPGFDLARFDRRAHRLCVPRLLILMVATFCAFHKLLALRRSRRVTRTPEFISLLCGWRKP
jgi:hypothetical protein